MGLLQRKPPKVDLVLGFVRRQAADDVHAVVALLLDAALHVREHGTEIGLELIERDELSLERGMMARKDAVVRVPK